MSRLYIKSSATENFLELASSKEAKVAYAEIKESLPEVSLAVFGAKDLSSLQRSHRHLNTSQISKTVPEFIAALRHPVKEKEGEGAI
ncbi:hypothetical protein [Halobacillus sp. BAB-2008]|uniref:hypothetical protein n=1 Tax=Halobacillus sp. BAB-2008 TaxID=1246484 RepID=UPI00058765C7|nr:hypothetical protein [Halobacillus sp. BAB-2008]